MELVEESSCTSPVVDEPEKMDATHEHRYALEDAVEAIGFGKFHILLTLCAGLLWASDSMEIAINALLPPTLVCEWNLTSVQEALIPTVNFIGQGVGALGWGYLSDRYGRKVALCASALTVFVFGVVSSLVPVYWSMLLCRCLVGVGIGGIPQTVTILTEVMPVQRRSKSVLIMKTFCGIGSLVAAGLAIGIVNAWGWRYYVLILSSPLLVFLISSWWIPESPRYLLITGQMGKLNALIQRIAKVNGKNEPEEVEEEVTVPSRGRISDLLTEKFRGTTLVLFFMWFTTAFCVHGMALLTAQMFQSRIDGCQTHMSSANVTSAGGCRRLTTADYTDYMITSGAEIPAILIVLLVIDKLGRRRCLTIEYGLGFVSILLLLFCSTRPVVVVLIFIFRGTLTSTFATIYLYTGE